MFTREKTRQVLFGPVVVGGGTPVRVESMTKTDTLDVGATLAQLEGLAAAGCEIARVAVPDETAAMAFGAISKASPIPLVADVHFDYRLGLACLEGGAAGMRWNPGNISKPKQVAALARELVAHGCPARVGVNAGSLDKDILARYGGATAAALAASALAATRRLEDLGVDDIIISAKSTSPVVMWQANLLIAAATDHPLHVGVTEAGFGDAGIVFSAVGIGLVLAAGIGDTIRVSLTDAPAREVAVAYGILRALDLRRRGPRVVSCPTCGRTEVNLAALAAEVGAALAGDPRDFTVAVMGCAVNGPGEAREADVGIAGGKGRGVIYRGGSVVRTENEDKLVAALLAEIEKLERS